MSKEVEAFLNKLHHPMLASIDLSLDRMHRLLGMIGSPQKRLPPVIHVAGTNGKGSLLANLYSIFSASGYKVHRYISPHLVRFNERILLAGKEIEDAHMINLLKHMAPMLSSQPATFFEATTALAFLAFAESKADILLLETGMGGRLDATNVIDKPLLTAITPISFDHTEYLGNTLDKIAGEKAAIIKKNVECVVGRQDKIALEIIEKQSEKVAAPLYRMGKEWNHENGIYKSQKRTLAFSPALRGDFQYDNAASAIACIDRLENYNISDAQIVKGIASANWPARLQNISRAFSLPPGIEVWLDGGHNPQGGEMLARFLAGEGREAHLVCAMGKGKDTKLYLAPLVPHVKKLYAIAIPEESNSQKAAEIAAAANALGIAAEPYETYEKSLQAAISHAKTPAIICICGSLYLAGKILARLEGKI